MHVDVLGRGRPAGVRAAVQRRVVHVAQRRAVAVDVDLLADLVVAGVGAVAGVELDHVAEDVAGRLVEATGLTGVGQPAGDDRGGHAVGHLVSGHVDRDQRLGVAGPVAVRHLGAVPEGVDVVVAVVHPARHTVAVAEDAVAAVHVLEVVVRLRRAVVGVDGRRLPVAGGAGAPGVVGVGDGGAGGGAVVHVAGAAVAPRRVDHLVRAAGERGVDGDGAGVDAVAGPGDRLDLVVGADELARGGVGDDVQLRRGLPVGGPALDDGLPGEAPGAAAGVDEELRGAGTDPLALEARLGRLRRPGRGDLGGGVDGQWGGQPHRGAGVAAVGGGVDDEVTAVDPQPLVAAGVAGVLRARGVHRGPVGRVRVVGGAADGGPAGLEHLGGARGGVGGGGGGRLGGTDDAGQHAAGEQHGADSGEGSSHLPSWGILHVTAVLSRM